MCTFFPLSWRIHTPLMPQIVWVFALRLVPGDHFVIYFELCALSYNRVFERTILTLLSNPLFIFSHTYFLSDFMFIAEFSFVLSKPFKWLSASIVLVAKSKIRIFLLKFVDLQNPATIAELLVYHGLRRPSKVICPIRSHGPLVYGCRNSDQFCDLGALCSH